MKYRKFLVYSIFMAQLILGGCLNGPSANPNSSIDGNIVGDWRLKIEGTAAFDEILRLSFTESGKFSKIDSSCFVGPSSSGDPCTVKYRWGGRYEKSGSTVAFYREFDSSDILVSGNMVRDTMEYSLRRLDNEALVMVYKFTTQSGSDSATERYYRVK